eukprot:2919646-Prymnesium_polylepis.1
MGNSWRDVRDRATGEWRLRLQPRFGDGARRALRCGAVQAPRGSTSVATPPGSTACADGTPCGNTTRGDTTCGVRHRGRTAYAEQTL